MTGQILLDSYRDAGVVVSVNLVNALAITEAHGRRMVPAASLPALRRILEVDPPSVAELAERHVAEFATLAQRLRTVFEDLSTGNIDAAANSLNGLLSACPANPHLARENGVWRLHHHPADAALVPMWTSICAEALARMIDAGFGGRLGICQAEACERVYFDTSRNGSRRFCSTACQNRTKTAAFRRRRGSRPEDGARS